MIPKDPHQPDWQPPFCPNPNCKYHHDSGQTWTYKKIGFFRRKAHPRCIQRYLCRHCKRSFSRQTFDFSYWQKRPDLAPLIFMKSVGCMANRQIARDLRCSPATIDHQISRLGRHCLLFHQIFWQTTVSNGPVVVDGFESFEYSQYHPFHFHLAVEADTGFFIYFTDSPLRRKGRMTAHQKRRRAELEERLGRPDPKAIEKDMAELLTEALRGRKEATVRSDDHRAYPRAMARVDCEIDHEVTSSQERRTNRNPLWEVNLLDLLIRHGQSQHKRETIAWSKRRQSSAEGLAMVLVWRNYMKFRWEKRCRQTPAMLKGLLDGPLQVEDVLRGRIFPSKVALPPRWQEYYERSVQTPALGTNRRHTLKLAY